MEIDTTIYVKIDHAAILSMVEQKSGRSRRDIVSLLMRRLADDRGVTPQPWKRIRYQPRSSRNDWCRLHLLLREDEYEFFLDLRKFYKRSVSFLIAYAITRYRDEILIIRNPQCDNYQYRNYILSRIIVDKITCWILYWGVPDTLVNCRQIE